eukprot:jgi/Chlat1/7475/Chrsp6S07472
MALAALAARAVEGWWIPSSSSHLSGLGSGPARRRQRCRSAAVQCKQAEASPPQPSSRKLRMTSQGIAWTDNALDARIEDARRSLMPGLHKDMVLWRRQIHSMPELAFLETQTSDLVASLLQEWGYEVHRGLGGTGVVGTLSVGTQREQPIMLRADMDALPVQELNSFDHASISPNVMHACGHDGHTAMLLGAAKHLASHRHEKRFEGTIHIVFQPAEEGTVTDNPGKRKGGGALAMLEEGLLERFPVRAAFGMHNWPGLAAGTFAVHSGPVMAAVDNFDITITGQGCHAAMPHLNHGRDPVVCAAQVVTALQASALVSRHVEPADSAVVSVTTIHGGDAHNVIPPEVMLGGTVRTFKSTTRTDIKKNLERIANGIAAAHGCSTTVVFDDGFPATTNTPQEAAICANVAAKVAGADSVRHDTIPPSMGGEDFGYILQRVPGCYLWIGNGPADSGCMLHNPRYDFNDEVLPLGAAYWVELVQTLLPCAQEGSV